MKKSKSMIIILSIVFIIALALLLVILAYNGFNVITWLFCSQQGLLVIFLIILIALFGFIIWYKMRDRL